MFHSKNTLFINVFILFVLIQPNFGSFRFVIENCFEDVRDEAISNWLMKHGMVLHVVISCANSNNIINAINSMSSVSSDRVAALVTSQMTITLRANLEVSDNDVDQPYRSSRAVFRNLEEWYPEMTSCNNRTLVTIPNEALNPIELSLSSGLYLLSGDNIDLYPVVMKNKKDDSSKCKSHNWATYLHAMKTNLDQDLNSKHLIIYVYNDNSKENEVSSARFLIGPPHNLAEDQRSLFLNCRDYEEHICLDDYKLSKPLYKIGVLEYPPFLMFTDKEKTKPKGIIVDMINILSSKMNFNYTFVVQDGGGERKADGSWVGAVASILNEEIDFVAADVSLRTDRAEVVEYSVPFIQGTTSVVIRRTMQSTTFGDMLRTHLRPFHWSIWLVICICLLISTGLLSYAYRPKLQRPVIANGVITRRNVQTIDTGPQEKETWWSIMFQILGIFCQQGCNLAPTRTSGRVILYTVCLTSLAIYNFYTSVFISFTTVMKNTIPVNSLIDVLRDNSYQVGFVHNDRFVDMFKESNTTLFKKAWAKMERNPSSFVQNNDEGIGKAFSEKYAFIDEFHSLYWYTSTNCSLKLLQDRFLPEGYYFLFPKGSSDILLFNKYLKRLIESGMINRFLSTHSPPVPQDLCDDAGTLEPVGLDRMAGLFICLGIGFSMTVISLWLEKIGRHDLGKQVKRVTIVMKK